MFFLHWADPEGLRDLLEGLGEQKKGKLVVAEVLAVPHILSLEGLLNDESCNDKVLWMCCLIKAGLLEPACHREAVCDPHKAGIWCCILHGPGCSDGGSKDFEAVEGEDPYQQRG
eukprot:7523397-Ditylum_brightwellii.AAC.2